MTIVYGLFNGLKANNLYYTSSNIMSLKLYRTWVIIFHKTMYFRHIF